MGATCRGSRTAGCPPWTAGSLRRRWYWRRKSRCWGGSPSSLALSLELASSSHPRGSWRTQAVWACPWWSGQHAASSRFSVSLLNASNWSGGAAGGLFLFFVWFSIGYQGSAWSPRTNGAAEGFCSATSCMQGTAVHSPCHPALCQHRLWVQVVSHGSLKKKASAHFLPLAVLYVICCFSGCKK